MKFISPATVDVIKRLGVNLAFAFVAVTADFAAKNLGVFPLDPTLATLIGVVLGDISQWADTHYDLYGRVARAMSSKPQLG